MARYNRRRRANLGVKLQAKRAFFPRRKGKTSIKKARRMRKHSIASPASYTTTIELLSTSNVNVNVNHPNNPNTAAAYTVYNVVPSLIEDLEARSVIYSKFKITKVTYMFKRATPAAHLSGVNYASIIGGDYHVAFPNTFNRVLPEPTNTNAGAIAKWSAQQTGAKKIFINTGSWKKSVRPYLTERLEFAGPSGYTPGPSVEVQRNRKMPWLDLESDLKDNLSLAQLVVMTMPVSVLTTIPTGSGGAGSNGMTIPEAQNTQTWDVTAKVTYMVKGRFLSKAALG